MVKQVVFFPSVKYLARNPYWPLLSRSLVDNGCGFDEDSEASFQMRWLVKKRGKVKILHFHFIQQFYSYELTHARLRWVLRMIRNLLAARVLGYRIIFTLHNLTPTYPLLPLWVDYLGHRAMFQLADDVIVHCQKARDASINLYGRKKNIHVLEHPNFIGIFPNNISREDARKRLEIPESSFVFLFFGGIRPNKGLENLILTFRRLDHKNDRLIIAGSQEGDQEYSDSLRSIISIDNRILYLSQFIQDSEIQIFMNAADIVILPFKRILTSSSIILSLSFAKPVILPAIGCLPEQVPEGSGIIYNQNDPEGLFFCLEKCRTKNLKTMGQKGFEGISKNSWFFFAMETKTIYEKMTRGGSRQTNRL